VAGPGESGFPGRWPGNARTDDAWLPKANSVRLIPAGRNLL